MNLGYSANSTTVRTLDGSMTLLRGSSPLELKAAGLEPLEGFNYLHDKFPTSHMKYISNKNGNRYFETDVTQFMGPDNLQFISNLLLQNGMNVNREVLLEVIAAANVDEDNQGL